MEHNAALIRQRVLQRRLPPGTGILFSRHHCLRRGHTDGNHVRRDTTPNLRLPQLVLLNCLSLQLSCLLASPDLILTLLGEELPGIAASNRCAANVIDGDRDTAVGEEGRPPAISDKWLGTSRQLVHQHIYTTGATPDDRDY
jgi:hypothetical protein